MVGPYIPVTESEIVKPWPIGGFLLANCQSNWGTGRGAKTGSKELQASPEACGGPKESQKPEEDNNSIVKIPQEPKEPEEDDNSIVEIPQEPKEPEVIIIDNEDEEAPAALVEPHRTPVNGGGDHDYLHPFPTWSKPKDHKLGDAMPECIHIDPDE